MEQFATFVRRKLGLEHMLTIDVAIMINVVFLIMLILVFQFIGFDNKIFMIFLLSSCMVSLMCIVGTLVYYIDLEKRKSDKIFTHRYD